jgi:hypothetical protein
MKKVMIIAVFASLALASCKKERECECVITSDAPGATSATVKVTIKKAKKDVCDKNSRSTIQTSPAAPSGSTYYTSTSTCTLK